MLVISLQGLEKYVMTKLFSRVFASIPEDVKADEQLHEKMALVQQFIRPEHLDIKPAFQNETSWLVSKSISLFCVLFCMSADVHFSSCIAATNW